MSFVPTKKDEDQIRILENIFSEMVLNNKMLRIIIDYELIDESVEEDVLYDGIINSRK